MREIKFRAWDEDRECMIYNFQEDADSMKRVDFMRREIVRR